ncbi:cutinase family protein [Nocardia jiangxiensis]|uniref:cutinase family protein n=1 Tax=Nocardia jiangxiensis TaxID=282685 RepID=UPI0012F65FA3|nr:cutinase family protein [Nocardia jiangxiensis]
MAIGGILPFIPAPAYADVCTGVWSIGVGGLRVNFGWPLAFTAEDSDYLQVDQRVGYNSIDLPAGVHELNRLVDDHRAQCPADHILLLGHSGGAAVVHVWVSEHKSASNLNAVLLADPKRVAGPGGPGFMAVAPMEWLPYPDYSGADADFGSVPVLEVCHAADGVCNAVAGPIGYFLGAHTDYDFSAADYSTTASGVVFQ